MTTTDLDLHARLLAEVDAEPQPSPLADALRAVVELHAPRARVADGDSLCCPHCYDDAIWPCATIRTIAEHLGVTP